MKMMKIGGQKMGKIQITKAKDSKEKKDKKIKTITILLLIFFVILLLLSGYTFAKSIEATTINADATIAEPISASRNRYCLHGFPLLTAKIRPSCSRFHMM